MSLRSDRVLEHLGAFLALCGTLLGAFAIYLFSRTLLMVAAGLMVAGVLTYFFQRTTKRLRRLMAA